jgi:hypothetical protein
MSKLAHSCDETMEAIAAAALEREALGWDEPPMQEYPKREIFRRGKRYVMCQIMNWEKGAPPRFLACHPLDGTNTDFIAMQGLGTWMEADIHDVARWLNESGAP